MSLTSRGIIASLADSSPRDLVIARSLVIDLIVRFDTFDACCVKTAKV